MVRVLLGLTVACGCALVPATAMAGTMSADGAPLFRPNPGETNTVFVVAAGGTLTVEDRTAPITAGTGCQQQTSSIVTCASAASELEILLRDGNDSALVTGIACLCSGDAGNDTLNGADGADRLNGGPGDDRMNGSLGADLLTGGDGVDSATYATPAPLSKRNTGVTVTLDDQANDGSDQDGLPGARDNVRSDVENITGSPLGDSLTGNAAANKLD